MEGRNASCISAGHGQSQLNYSVWDNCTCALLPLCDPSEFIVGNVHSFRSVQAVSGRVPEIRIPVRKRDSPDFKVTRQARTGYSVDASVTTSTGYCWGLVRSQPSLLVGI
ncbi:uncharacterized protein MEPE_04558 [Melanopsichium pennsylvanicum]|uniref:Uncharacterized protein n=1 Tax=Melanopsichium pennsylvanicum TaxID=63383 RepID=A0AAJ4XNZ4_9BASI|nr:uncharacterized protein MEPE_04558 [Melanopsichium pennsylvanicum]